MCLFDVDMPSPRAVFFCLLVSFIHDINGQNYSSQGQLIHDLIDTGYDVRIIPSVTGQPVKVRITLFPFSVLDVDERNQVFHGSSWLKVNWNDSRLIWDPVAYGNISRVHVPMEFVWTPPILIYNSIASHSPESPLQSDASKVAIYQDGSAQIQTTLFHSTTCDINLKEFPFDSHECNLSFIPQGLPNDVFKFESGQVLSLGDTNPQWVLSAIVLDTYEETDPVYNETFSFLNVRFIIARLPDFYIRMIAVPLQLLNTLALMAFFIPLKSGERVSSCLSLVLGQTVFQIIIADILPRTSRADREPILINFVLTSFLTLVCITVASALTVNLSFQPWRIRNRTSKYVVFHILAAVTLMKLPQNRCQNSEIGTTPANEVSPDECKHHEAENSNSVQSDTHNPSSASEEMTDMEFLAACIDRVFFFIAVIAFILVNAGAFKIVQSSLQAMVR